MRICSFRRRGETEGKERAGAVGADGVTAFGGRGTVFDLLASPRGRLPDAEGETLGMDEVVIGPPLRRPGKIVAAIVNTQGMLGGGDVRLDHPRLDMKAPSTVIGPGEVIVSPKSGLRPEVELGAVVGRRMKEATADEARESFLGYTIVNDVTAPSDSREDAYEAYRRDRVTGQVRKATLRGPLFRSKNHDTFCPTGPWIVTPEEIGDIGSLSMRTSFDGELVQEGSTADYLFAPSQLASYISRFLTLEPGDLVSCGSVGWTREALGTLDPTEYLLPKRRGELRLEVQGIGTLANPVAYEVA